jgi:nitrogen fixation NifU-like protein
VKDALYHDRILALARRRTGAGRLETPDASATIDNPLCGDRVTLDLRLEDGRIAAVGHKTRGCLLCQAAATVIAEHAPGLTVQELRDLTCDLRPALTERPEELGARWPELAAFAPVHGHKSRYDCVLLPFDALREALKERPD